MVRKLRIAGSLRSVRARILASILLVTIAGMTIAGVAAFLLQRERVMSTIDTKLTNTVDALRFIAAGGQGSNEVPATVSDFLTLAMQRVLPDHNESTVGLVDGAPAFVPSSDLSFRLDEDEKFIALVTSLADTDNVVMGTVNAEAGQLRYVIIPVRLDGDDTVGHYVSAYNLDAEVEAIADSFRTYAAIAAITLFLVGLVAWGVAGRLLRPIRTLRDTAARITESDLSERIEVVGSDDVSDLTATVNDMLGRLEGAFISQRRLLDDVGHELKTPITIIRGHLELLDPEHANDLAETRELAIAELDRMTTLVSDIALLATSQTPGFVNPIVCPVSDLTRSVYAKAKALSTKHQWVLAETAELTALIDVQRMTQAWLQLAENAAKYCPQGTAIEIGSTPSVDDGELFIDLWVRDHGPGIPVNQLERVFDRFMRSNEGRGVDGSGLGLSIVTAIANAHDGRAFAINDHRGGTKMVIRIPRGSRTGTGEDPLNG
ncbi:MAG: sensor histidine kinase [Homoserinimonas sp.]|nr:sensor histidine kinase [Homoserinimonas sp.]